MTKGFGIVREIMRHVGSHAVLDKYTLDVEIRSCRGACRLPRLSGGRFLCESGLIGWRLRSELLLGFHGRLQRYISMSTKMQIRLLIRIPTFRSGLMLMVWIIDHFSQIGGQA